MADLTYEEYRAIWDSLDEDQRDSVRLKAEWEHVTLWTVCEQWPGIWDDPDRLAQIRGSSDG